MQTVENGDYYCSMFMCENKARHIQKTEMGTILLCSDCLGELWKMPEIAIRRLKGEDV